MEKTVDFDVLGDFFMANTMGSNHASMNQMMIQRLGENGEKQMHITMGKRLSGCNTSASFLQGSSYFMPMIGLGGMMSGWNNKPFSGNGKNFGNFGTKVILLKSILIYFLYDKLSYRRR